MLERDYQSYLIKRLKRDFPGCFILKNDTTYLQGIPDLLILFGNRWAMLEVKSSLDARSQPNQEFYVDLLDEMSFAMFICPETEDRVIDDLALTFGAIL
jgi:hypothetical protein